MQTHLWMQRKGNGNRLQYSCLGNSVDREAWWANSPWGHKESDTTEQLSTYFYLYERLKQQANTFVDAKKKARKEKKSND